jgi:hypothetical protein
MLDHSANNDHHCIALDAEDVLPTKTWPTAAAWQAHPRARDIRTAQMGPVAAQLHSEAENDYDVFQAGVQGALWRMENYASPALQEAGTVFFSLCSGQNAQRALSIMTVKHVYSTRIPRVSL